MGWCFLELMAYTFKCSTHRQLISKSFPNIEAEALRYRRHFQNGTETELDPTPFGLEITETTHCPLPLAVRHCERDAFPVHRERTSRGTPQRRPCRDDMSTGMRMPPAESDWTRVYFNVTFTFMSLPPKAKGRRSA